MDLSSLLTRGIMKDASGYNKIGTATGQAYPMNNYEIFMNDLVNNPQAVYEAIVQQIGEWKPVSQASTVQPQITDDAAATKAYEAPNRNMLEKKRLQEELMKQI